MSLNKRSNLRKSTTRSTSAQQREHSIKEKAKTKTKEQQPSSYRARDVANVQQGTADILPFDDQRFDIVIFGFCLYLCDREDLFRIASEADRVLRMPGWLFIRDFFSSMPRAKTYHHRPGVLSYKMDYRTLFNWHPDYECMTHKLRHHSKGGFTDEQDEWVAVSVLRKHHKDLTA